MAGTFVEHVNQLAADLTPQLILDITSTVTNAGNISAVAANEPNIDLVAANIPAIDAIVATVIPNMAEILLADNNAVTATTGATQAQLRKWEAEAERMTADSYATEPEDVFVKVYTSVGDGTFTSVNTAEYSALHWRNKTAALILTVPLINDETASLTTTYSGTKTKDLHDAQSLAIANLAGASATIHNHVSQPIPEDPAAFVDLTWVNEQASTNANILELGVNTFILKQNGSYNFYSTLTFYRLSAGTPMTVTFELYDSVSMAVLGTYTQVIDMAAGTKATTPMNSLLLITGLTAGQTKIVKVRMQATAATGTLELFDFHSILALSSVSIVPTIDAVPTDGSANLVASNGVFDALAGKQNTLTFDAVPTNGSTNPVESNGIFDAIAAKADAANYLALAGGDMTGTIREVYAVIAASDIAVSTASVFSKTISGATTFTLSSVPASPKVSGFTLELTNGGSAVVTWWAGIKWTGGTAPTLTAAGLDILEFYTRDGGTTWRGFVSSKDNK